jgi:hypothetical protein
VKKVLRVFPVLWLALASGPGARARERGDVTASSPALAARIGEEEVVNGLRLVLEHKRHRGASGRGEPEHVHLRLVNVGKVAVRVFLGGDPFGAVPFEFSVDASEPIPIAAEHRHDGKTVTRVLRPGKDYLVELGPDPQFVGHTLVARYHVDPADGEGCWTGLVLSAGLMLTR